MTSPTLSNKPKGLATLGGFLGCLFIMTVFVVACMALIFAGVGILHWAVECWRWWAS